MTKSDTLCIVEHEFGALCYRQIIKIEELLFRVVEIHRICETTATPEMEGAYLSEFFEQ